MLHLTVHFNLTSVLHIFYEVYIHEIAPRSISFEQSRLNDYLRYRPNGAGREQGSIIGEHLAFGSLRKIHAAGLTVGWKLCFSDELKILRHKQVKP